MSPFEKNETTIRMGLSRAVKSNLLKNIHEGDKVFYEIREKGLESIAGIKEIIQVFSKKISMKRNGWNNYWCVVSVESDANVKERDEFLSYIKILGFAQLNRGTYIFPFDLTKELKSKIEELKIDEYVNVFESKLVSFQSAARLAKRLWKIDELKKKYFEFTIKYPPTTTLTNIGESSKLILLCHNFIHDFNEIIQIDPVLPAEFLGPGWEGENALRIVDHFNKTFVPPTKELVERILNSTE